MRRKGWYKVRLREKERKEYKQFNEVHTSSSFNLSGLCE